MTDPWLRSLMDLECFVLSGMTAAHTLTAEVRPGITSDILWPDIGVLSIDQMAMDVGFTGWLPTPGCLSSLGGFKPASTSVFHQLILAIEGGHNYAA